MTLSVQPLAVLSTMEWVYAASALLVVLFVLLVAPYFGVYGTRDISTDQSPSAQSEQVVDDRDKQEAS